MQSTPSSAAAAAIASGKAAFDRVAERLREEIISGGITSGTRLHENDLSATYGASRNTVREALRQLRCEGLVDYVRHKGVIVRFVTAAEVRDIYKVRRALELRAIEESSLCGDHLLRDLPAAIDSAEAAMESGDWRRVGTSSLRFHQAVVALLESELINGFFKSILAQLRLIFALMADERSFQSPWIARDRHIYELLARGARMDAANALRIYLDESERSILDVVRSLQRT